MFMYKNKFEFSSKYLIIEKLAPMSFLVLKMEG